MPIHLPPTSRRRFLSGLAAGGAAIMAGGRAALGRWADEPGGYLALIADTHVAADAAKVAREQNMTENLRAVVKDILAQPEPPRAALVLGDLAFNSGEAGDYTQFLSLIKPLRDNGIPVHLTMGNHDVRSTFLNAIKATEPIKSPVDDRCVSVVDAAGLRFLILDSLEAPTPEGRMPIGGQLHEAQLDWLTETLDAHPNIPALILFHHNPTHDPARLKNCLGDTEKLFSIVGPRKQVKAVVYGHTHQWELAKEDDLQLINLPATAYIFSPEQPLGWCRFEPRDGGATIEPRCVSGNRDVDKKRFDLKWRGA